MRMKSAAERTFREYRIASPKSSRSSGQGSNDLPVDNPETRCIKDSSDARVRDEPDDGAEPVALVDAYESARSRDGPCAAICDMIKESSCPSDGILHPFFCVEVVAHTTEQLS